MAEAMGRGRVTADFDLRAASWRNLFDPETRFLRARNADGSFAPDFDAMSTHGQGYIEGNAWNYSLFVPHDPAGFIDLLGGPEKLVEWLDELFVMEVEDESIADTEDVTRAGLIGAYVHGNEPSHHVPYLYSYAGMALENPGQSASDHGSDVPPNAGRALWQRRLRPDVGLVRVSVRSASIRWRPAVTSTCLAARW